MAQKIISGNVWNALHDTDTEYNGIDGEATWITTGNISVAMTNYCAVAGTLKKFRLILLNAAGDVTAPPTGKTFAFTIRKNEADTNLKVTIGEGITEAQDLVNTVPIIANDRLHIQCVPTGGAGANRYAIWSLEFVPTTDGESVYFNGGGTWVKDEAAGYAPLVGASSFPHLYAEANVRQYAAAAGKIKDLRLTLSNNPGSGAEGYALTLRKNGSTTALEVIIRGANTAGSDTSNEITVAPGDLLDWYIQPLASPTNSLSAGFGFAFDPDNNNESLFANGWPENTLNTGATAYMGMHGNPRDWSTAEKNVWQLAQKMVIQSLYIEVSAAPGAGKSWVFTVMKNSVATNLAVTISGLDTTGNDLDDEISFDDDDYISLRAVPSGTPAAANARWGAMQITTLTSEGNPALAGFIWQEGKYIAYIDENGIKRYAARSGRDVNDTPADGATQTPISSNWAYDHENASAPHSLHPIVCVGDEVVCNKNEVVYN